jgi:hypothetical protein
MMQPTSDAMQVPESHHGNLGKAESRSCHGEGEQGPEYCALLLTSAQSINMPPVSLFGSQHDACNASPLQQLSTSFSRVFADRLGINV